MAKTSWLAEDTITEVELARQTKLGAVTEMTVEQTPQGYQVIVQLNWHPAERVALRTRRSATQPRLFKSLERLVAHIRERYPAIRQVRIELLTAAPANAARRSTSKGRPEGAGGQKQRG